MASQSLYRKWRSQTFSDMVGQEPVIRTLKNALNTGNLSHAYLFTGPRGTGKTSTARLLAKTINCLNPQSNEPCNECEQCREISSGSSFNVIEIDAASNRGIDSIRELREKVMVPPSTGKYKVYILDEAHMLTVEAFNALLKTLEEPPEHAIFVMATTDVHKMLPTVLSRCQRFDFKRFTTRQIVDHLRFVAGEEGVTLDGGAAELIARAAAGGMRDALSLLDQAMAYSGHDISLAQVQTMLGVADPRAIQKCVSYVANLDSSEVLHLIHELAEAGADLRQLNTQIAEYWRGMMLARAGANIGEILDVTQDEATEIQQTAQSFSLEELTESARIFAQNDLVQRSQATPQLGLELAFLACVELHRHGGPVRGTAAALSPAKAAPSPAPAVGRSPSSQERPRMTTAPSMTSLREDAVAPAPIAPPSPAPQAPTTQPVVASSAPSRPSVPTTPQVIDEEPFEDLPAWEALSYTAGSSPTEVRAPVNTPPAQPPVTEAVAIVAEQPVESGYDAPDLTIDDVKEKWELVKRRVKTRKDGPKIAAFLNGFAIVEIEGSHEAPVVAIRAIADFHYKSLQKSEYHDIINWALKVELEQECKIRVLAPGSSSAGVAIPPVSNMLGTVSAQPSAYRERPAPAPSTPAPARTPSPGTPPARSAAPATPAPAKSAPKITTGSAAPEAPMRASVPPTSTVQPASLARNQVVSENSTARAQPMGETRLQEVEKQVKNDPVVKEVMRIFKAEIKDIQLK